MHVILEEGLADEAFIDERTEGFEELPKLLAAYTPEVVEQISGVPAERIRTAARIFGTAARASILYSMGITQHSHGTENVLAIANLALLTGNLGRPGAGVNPLRGQNNVQGACDMGALPNVYTGYQSVDDEAARNKFDAAWDVDLGAAAGAHSHRDDRRHGRRPGQGRLRDGREPDAVGSGPAACRAAAQGPGLPRRTGHLPDRDGRLADVVLPATSFAEKDGTFTNTERRVQRVRAAVPPPGEAREDWAIVADLALGLGAPAEQWAYRDPADIMTEINELTPSYGGITYGRIEHDGLCWPCPDTSHAGTPILHIGSFTCGKGKFFPIAYQVSAEAVDEEYPLILTTGRMLEHYHTGTMTRRSDGLNELVPTGFVEIHPEDAAALGITDSAAVTVETRRGAISIPANVTDRVRPGTVFVPFHFWESPANRLTNTARDPMAKIPEFKVCACRVTQ